MAQKLKFGNGVWANKKGSTLAYNDENDNYKPLPFTFTRASTATRVNKAGLIEVVGHNQPRIDYTDSSNGSLLLEPVRTNLETKSNNFSTWGAISNITRTADYIISPDGTLNGTRLQFTANGFVASTPQSLATYTVSCYAKRNDNGTQNVGFFTNGSGVVNSAWDITSEWKRFSYTFPALNASFMGIAGVSGADISVYGFQIEGLASYATSYIPTNGSAVTRAAETCNGSGNAATFNDSEGVLMVESSLLDVLQDGIRISISDGSSAENRITFRYLNDNQIQIELGLTNGFSETLNLDNSENFNKIAVVYNSTNASIFINGFNLVTDTMSALSGLSQLQFNRFNANIENFHGNVKQVQYFNLVLDSEQLEQLTSWDSFRAMAEGQLYTIE